MTTQDKHDNRVEVNGNGVTSLSGLVLKGYRPCAVCGTSVPVGNDYDGSPVMHGICEDSLNPSFCGECERFKATGFVTDDDGVQHRSCVECAAKGPDLGFDWLFTPDLQVRIDHEPTRDAIECRAQATGWSDPAPVACRALSGEILRSAQLTDTQGVIVFERKYGERPGYRTVVLTAPDASKPLVLVTNAFADAPKTTGNMERIKTFRDKKDGCIKVVLTP